MGGGERYRGGGEGEVLNSRESISPSRNSVHEGLNRLKGGSTIDVPFSARSANFSGRGIFRVYLKVGTLHSLEKDWKHGGPLGISGARKLPQEKGKKKKKAYKKKAVHPTREGVKEFGKKEGLQERGEKNKYLIIRAR